MEVGVTLEDVSEVRPRVVRCRVVSVLAVLLFLKRRVKQGELAAIIANVHFGQGRQRNFAARRETFCMRRGVLVKL